MRLDTQETHCHSVRVHRASHRLPVARQVRPVQPQAFAGSSSCPLAATGCPPLPDTGSPRPREWVPLLPCSRAWVPAGVGGQGLRAYLAHSHLYLPSSRCTLTALR